MALLKEISKYGFQTPSVVLTKLISANKEIFLQIFYFDAYYPSLQAQLPSSNYTNES